MAICAIIWKALRMRRALNRMERAKENAYRDFKGYPPIYSWYQSCFRKITSGIKWIFVKTCCTCFRTLEEDEELTEWDLLWTRGTLANSIMLSVFGFLCGIGFTVALSFFLVRFLNFDPNHIVISTVLFGIILSFGLAFSSYIRCVSILAIPQFFTRKGRTVILFYAMILAVSGPGKNTLLNMEILTESLICGQEVARNATGELVKMVKDPLNSIKNTVKTVIEELKGVAKTILEAFQFIFDAISSIVDAIKTCYEWLKEISSICNDEFGSPFEKCIESFNYALKDCKKEVGEEMAFLCEPVDAFQHICQVAKLPNVIICFIPSLIKSAIFDPIKEKMDQFFQSVKLFFDVRLSYDYTFDHKLESSKGFKKIFHGIKQEIYEEVGWFFDYIDWSNLFTSFTIFLIFYKAMVYRLRYLHLDRHDNQYITKGLIRIDIRMRRIGRDSIFPLRYREARLYIEPFSFIMLKSEIKRLKLSLYIVTTQSIQIMVILALDTGMFFFLKLIQEYGKIKVEVKDLGFEVKVEGDGYLADMYRAIIHGISPIFGGFLPSIDTTPCLPNPSLPNFTRYMIIFFLILICYFLAFSEAYGLRLRQFVCHRFYPERQVLRNRWLYNHIRVSRGSFFGFAMSQVKDRLFRGRQAYKIGLKERMQHTIPFCRTFLQFCGGKEKKRCFLCGRPGDLDDFEEFIHCQICYSVYCVECFEDLEKKCPVCNAKFHFDMEFSEESGSHSDSSKDSNLDSSTDERVKRASALQLQYPNSPDAESESDSDYDYDLDKNRDSVEFVRETRESRKLTREDASKNIFQSDYESSTEADEEHSEKSENFYKYSDSASDEKKSDFSEFTAAENMEESEDQDTIEEEEENETIFENTEFSEIESEPLIDLDGQKYEEDDEFSEEKSEIQTEDTEDKEQVDDESESESNSEFSSFQSYSHSNKDKSFSESESNADLQKSQSQSESRKSSKSSNMDNQSSISISSSVTQNQNYSSEQDQSQSLTPTSSSTYLSVKTIKKKPQEKSQRENYIESQNYTTNSERYEGDSISGESVSIQEIPAAAIDSHIIRQFNKVLDEFEDLIEED